ncbi:ArsA-related P-loop ATPase [Streptomyces sp. B-S-A8]|uniref:ArsA-related P-loop ATPase n=1 Tax=Streptomyces solicavernae TaxID=3043614 RepID=A0ABT6RS63_9ACTN|nr:ArsA-related P-loop ATPase [Streptomyces sp. B-S-A8]MDI3387165.1 ArsA-related P-loop ATPase [Streptomyces sp. B-S-A8]
MQTLLVTGPGGSGRTTTAAATALAAARDGRRTLLLTADAHDTLPAVLGAVELPGLTVRHVDSGAHFRRELLALQDRAATALDLFGAQRLDEEELTELPGAGELALLRAVRDAAAQPYDLVVVDLPPAPQALALLALPAQLRRYLRRLLPPERQAARALRPMLAQLAGVPMPAQWLYDTAAHWDQHLAAVQSVIEADTTAVRLVAEPGPAGADAVHTARTGFALHALRTELLVANRVLPHDSADPWLASAAAQQDKALAEWRDAYPLHAAAHLGRDPRGADDLAALALPLPDPVPDAVQWPVEDRLADDGVLVWRIPLPGAVREDLDLVRRGDELVVTVGPFRRMVPLPSALRRCTVSGAGLRDGELRIRFTPDPGLWPQGR